MQSNVLGMDPDAARQLAQSMTLAADAFDTASRQLTTKLDSTPWTGPDRNTFHGQWTGDGVTSIRRTVDMLRLYSDHLVRQADSQEQASNS